MSVVVTVNYEDETLEVEIFRDGGLNFPGRDLEHDQVVVALGGKPSMIVRFDDSWTKDTIKAVFKVIKLPENSNVLLVADYAEHVLPFYEHKYPGDVRPWAAITAARDFVFGKIDISVLHSARVAALSAAVAQLETARAAADTAWAAVEAAGAAEASAPASNAVLVLALAMQAAAAAEFAAAYNVSSDMNSLKWQQAHDAEVAWQIRRFVDCMEAVGQELPWPPLEATE